MNKNLLILLPILLSITPVFAWKLEGDVNRDCIVNALDLGMLNAYWGSDNRRDIGDVDHNGVTDVFDILLIKYYYGATRGSDEYKGYLDLNKDGIIDDVDIGLLIEDFAPIHIDKYCGWVDLNKDGMITSADWEIVLNNWGKNC